MGLIMHLDYRRLREPVAIYALLGGVLVLLVAVLSQPELNGTRRWFFVGGFSAQPSELAKLALIPFLAYQIDRKSDRVNHPEVLVPAAFFTLLTAGLILLEPDLGTAVLLVSHGVPDALPGRPLLALRGRPGGRLPAAAVDPGDLGRPTAASGCSPSSTRRRTRWAAASRPYSR